MSSAAKNGIFWVVMVATALLLWAVVRSRNPGERIPELSFTEFVHELNRDNVREVKVTRAEAPAMMRVTGIRKKDGARFTTTVPTYYPDLYKSLVEKNVDTVFRDEPPTSSWLNWFGNGLLPIVILTGFWIFFMRQMKGRSKDQATESKNLAVKG